MAGQMAVAVGEENVTVSCQADGLGKSAEEVSHFHAGQMAAQLCEKRATVS
jgi:hypothetical protein